MKEEKKIYVFDLWADNFESAKKFFKSKGNVQTRSNLKDKWFKEFKEMIEKVYSHNR